MSSVVVDVRLVSACGTDLAPGASRWFREPDHHDLAALDRLEGPVLDVGCGPGRIVTHLAGTGVPALGVDVSSTAVQHTRARGAPVLHRSIFDPLPGAGRWGAAVLLDGNIGIGGDPVPLLRRVRTLVRGGGRIVVEVEPPGVASRVVDACFVIGDHRSTPFPWAIVSVDDIGGLAAAAGVPRCSARPSGVRWFATLHRD